MSKYTQYTGDELARLLFPAIETKPAPVRSVPSHHPQQEPKPLPQKTQPWKDGSLMARISRLFDNMGTVGWKDTPPYVAAIYAQCSPQRNMITSGNLEATARRLDRRESLISEHDINNSEYY